MQRKERELVKLSTWKDSKMKKEKKFKLKVCPTLPVRDEKYRFEYHHWGNTSLVNLIEWAENNNLPLESVELGFDYNVDPDYAYSNSMISAIGLEPKEEFDERMVHYEKELAEYKQWEEKNKDAIKEALVREAEEKKDRQAKKVESFIKSLRAEERRIEKQKKELELKRKELQKEGIIV